MKSYKITVAEPQRVPLKNRLSDTVAIKVYTTFCVWEFFLLGVLLPRLNSIPEMEKILQYLLSIVDRMTFSPV